MALNWKQEVSVDSLKSLFKGGKGGTGVGGYPSKTTMNLYQGDKQTVDLRNVIIVGILLAVGITLFVKFGVMDQLARLSQKEAELAEQQSLVTEVASSSADYETIKEAYDAYMAQYGNSAIDAIQVLDMVEQHVKSVAEVTSIVLSDGTLTLTLYNVPLNTVGDLAKELENQPMVDRVNVSTATTQSGEGQNTTSTLVVTLVHLSSEE